MTTRQRTLLLEQPCLASAALALIAPEDATAILDGRLFVGRRRILNEVEPLGSGQVVIWNAPREVSAAEGEPKSLVLARRGGIVAAAKPAAWSSEPDRTGSATSLREQLAKALRAKDVHIATRLDVGVSGLVLAATTSDSRKHLATVMATEVHRRYVAITTGTLPDRGTWQGGVEPSGGSKARNAITHFECRARRELVANVTLGQGVAFSAVSLLLLSPETGHRHQLRIHSSRAQSPIVGDKRYGGPNRLIDAEGRVMMFERIFLHALTTTVPLPDASSWQPYCPIDSDFRSCWLALGGDERDFSGLLS